jgi:hypothetical protein
LVSASVAAGGSPPPQAASSIEPGPSIVRIRIRFTSVSLFDFL